MTRPLAESTVVIVGLGMLGGSLARALQGWCAGLIGVVEAGDDDARRTALALKVVDEVEDLDAAVARADIVVLAAPVQAIVDLLPAVARVARPGTLVTDVGSTKCVVVAAMDALGGGDSGDGDDGAQSGGGIAWAGGHPMCGGTTTGLGATDAALFEGARWAICATQAGGDAAVARVAELVEAVGADPVIVDADEHDRAVALVSHLPRVVAVTLAEMLAAREPADPLPKILAARGWRGATRLADGDTRMWNDVLATNGHEVAAAVRELAERLEGIAEVLDAVAPIAR